MRVRLYTAKLNVKIIKREYFIWAFKNRNTCVWLKMTNLAFVSEGKEGQEKPTSIIKYSVFLLWELFTMCMAQSVPCLIFCIISKPFNWNRTINICNTCTICYQTTCRLRFHALKQIMHYLIVSIVPTRPTKYEFVSIQIFTRPTVLITINSEIQIGDKPIFIYLSLCVVVIKQKDALVEKVLTSRLRTNDLQLSAVYFPRHSGRTWGLVTAWI